MPAEESPRKAVTQLLASWKGGSKEAMDSLAPIVYTELRQLALRYLFRERAAMTLQPTALVHEAYLRLVGHDVPDWESRSHFFGVAAHLMRQILVDHARKKRTAKRGGGAVNVCLDSVMSFGGEQARDIEALNDALEALAAFDERKCKVIELRFFGGFSLEETARALNISVATAGREQRMAEAWLYREVAGREKPLVA